MTQNEKNIENTSNKPKQLSYKKRFIITLIGVIFGYAIVIAIKLFR